MKIIEYILSPSALIPLFLGSLITWGIAHIYYLKTSIVGKISYSILSDTVAFPHQLLGYGMEIVYKGEKIDTVVSDAYVVIWNSGNTVIDNKSIIESDPINLVFRDNTKILDVKMIYTTRNTNEISFNIDNEIQNKLNINFGFLNPKDGAICKVLVTDRITFPLKKDDYPFLYGTIKGISTFSKKRSIPQYMTNKDIEDYYKRIYD